MEEKKIKSEAETASDLKRLVSGNLTLGEVELEQRIRNATAVDHLYGFLKILREEIYEVVTNEKDRQRLLRWVEGIESWKTEVVDRRELEDQ